MRVLVITVNVIKCRYALHSQDHMWLIKLDLHMCHPPTIPTLDYGLEMNSLPYGRSLLATSPSWQPFVCSPSLPKFGSLNPVPNRALTSLTCSITRHMPRLWIITRPLHAWLAVPDGQGIGWMSPTLSVGLSYNRLHPRAVPQPRGMVKVLIFPSRGS